MVWSDLSSSWWTISFQSQQTLSITVLGVNLDFSTVCEASPRSEHHIFHTLMSCKIYFATPIYIYFKNGSISFGFSRDSQMGTWSIRFFTVNSHTQVLSFFWYPALYKLFKTVFWSMFSFTVMSQDEMCQFIFIF